MGSDHDRDFRSLDEIRDRVIMLDLGRAYLCEEPFLRKFGRAIEVHLDRLREDISVLKKEFPGKFENEVETGEIFEKGKAVALRLTEPDRETLDRCTIGDLGKELDGLVRSLTRSILSVRMQVEGSPPAYTKKDSLLGFFDWLKPIGTLFSFLSGRFLKILLVLVLAAGVAFSILFSTMERAEPIQERIKHSEAIIRSQKEILADLIREKEDIFRGIESLKRADQTRERKVEIMDLHMKARDVEEKENNVHGEIGAHEAIIQQSKEKLEEMREKSFLERLLRLS
ncbi:MAG: hypothetical protein JW821_02590 [Deltaproteobacteria bacterium]|nr:hypothetical protein [Deltaproteobacteria bacterium]